MASNFVIDYLLTVKSESDRCVLSKLTLLLDFVVILGINGTVYSNLFNIRNQTWCYCDKMICEALGWLSYDIIIVQQFCKSVIWITVSLKVLKQVKREVHHECNKFHCCCVWVPCAGYLTFFS